MSAGYQAVDRRAWAPRLRVSSVLTRELIFAVGFTAAWTAAVMLAGGWKLLIMLGFAVPVVADWLRRLRRRGSPVVVDAPGVWFGAEDGSGDERLVHWEMVAAVIVFQSRVPGSRHLHDGLGVRLRARPDLVPVRRVLLDRRVDRARLEAAVGRYAPDVPVVDWPGDPVVVVDRPRDPVVGWPVVGRPGDLDDASAAHDTAEAMISAVREAQPAAGSQSPGRRAQPTWWRRALQLERRER
jgi:hypothetical protein